MSPYRSQSPRYVLPRCSKAPLPCSKFFNDEDMMIMKGCELPQGSSPPAAPAVPGLGDSWLDGFPANGDDVFEAISARAVAAPLKVVGTIGGLLAVSGCGQTKESSFWRGDDVPMMCPREPIPDSNSSVSEDVQPKKSKKNRFCKGKRDRYRKLVERLIPEARRNPTTFDLEAIVLPAAIASSEAMKAKLWSTVMRLALASDSEDTEQA